MRYLEINGRQVSAIGLGAWQFGAKEWGWGTEYGSAEVRQIIDRALELGINFIDTAEMYGGGESERLIGQALQGQRDQAFIATKVSPHHLLRGPLRRAAEGSRQRLAMEAVDLYQVHWPVALVSHRLTMGAMRELQLEGRVQHVGVSNYSLAGWRHAEEALGVPIVSNQVRYHLLHRSVEREVLPYAQASGRLIIAYSPLGQGLLSGRYAPDNLPRGARLMNPLFTPDNVRRAQGVIDVLRQVGQRHGAEPAQVALAWLLYHPNVLVIPGAKSVAQVEANAAAADIELSGEEFDAITGVSNVFGSVGWKDSVVPMFRRLVAR